MESITPQELIDIGRFSEAASQLENVINGAGKSEQADIMRYARALMATSRYGEAFNVLNLAMTDRVGTARALALQSEIRWIEHHYEEAYNIALASLQLDLFNGRVQTIRDRCKQVFEGHTRQVVPGVSGNRKLGHVAFYVAPGGNFGDLALPPTVRATVAHWRPVSEWTTFHVHQKFDAGQVEAVNALDGLVVGGGGLFLPDTAPNGHSGWQWNIPIDYLRKINVPIYIIAVGYNLFRGQSFLGNTFRRSLNGLVEKAAAIGLRNSGSIAQVRTHLAEDLQAKVCYMPCPTTILSRLIPEALDPIDVEAASKRVFINAAFDRSANRFGDKYHVFLDRMAQYISSLLSDGLSVEIAAHLPRDEKLSKDLYEQYGIKLPVHGLYDMSCEDGYNLYRQAGLVVGMRGHASMIPFGLGVPFLSIVSHPKMQFFLDDIERPHWGIDVDSPNFYTEIYEATIEILDDNVAVRDDMRIIQERLYNICEEFISIIR